MTTTPRIAIVGGGPAGLMCARVLQRHGIEAAVYDADTAVDSRDPGGTLDLHADSGQIALEDAGLMDAFMALARTEGQAKTSRDHHGTVRAAFVPTDDDTAAPEIDRGQLRAMLHAHLRPGTVRWGHKLLRVAPDGDGAHLLEFADGGRVSADLVVGADGAWSKVRPLLTDAVPEYLGVCFLDVRYDDVDTRHPGIAELVGHGHMFANDGDGRAVIVQRNSDGVVRGYIAFRAEADWHTRAGVDLTDRAAVRAFLLREFSGWSALMRPMLTDNDSDYLPRAFHALPAPLTWRRVPGATLVGDAAHLMAPFGGHGTNLALLDAAELARAIAEEATVDAAVARHEAAMFARSGELAVQSNAALRRFFATTSPDAPHLPPDHAAEHEEYRARAAEYRRRQGEAGRA
ncbi:FAD-dependent oxidoreductase [Streptantibioticus cattleyicolor]|uniref:Flavin-dependent monooxygenase n=1 Tax=Streptantibioticus cattleyicolor (strain ATCC 35852 / DSM 46488 / JCM 4925 / NBRC 14057 / NRRL 8057) TaxID=1003195 RepID=F8JKD5_STREN|nr:NAD(P)/FAD-dependent oxidoreductase [Streptantibioticus cattleyicolor]AEW98501.1 monooxygenase [Streptantibioticus cattleyicolor NRRL 8057 = DSM 46488]CCB72441.1 Monooxygenase [Streptantibioticus cattleyicolor NRRL 8057 = DSM 46488]